MTIETMIQKKKEFGYSYQQISELSKVPLGTVQKIFNGQTKAPRHKTIEALSKVFEKKGTSYYSPVSTGFSSSVLQDSGVSYSYGNSLSQDKTIEDYLALPDDVRVELIDGKFYDMASPSFIHQQIAGLIYNKFVNHVDEHKGSCIPAISPLDVQLDCDDKTMVQPDVLIICDRDKILKPRVYGAPDLVVEVLSPNNWHTDIVLKERKYRNAGVREYWIVLPDQKLVMVYNYKISRDFVEYTFEDKVPVGIWDGKCEVDFNAIYERIRFLYDDQQ